MSKTPATETAHPPPPENRPVYKNPNLHIIFGITLTAILGVSSITPAFPAISRSLDISADRVALLITVFTLPGIFLTPIFGVLADRYGRKLIVVPSLFIFAVAGSACALAEEFNTLLLLRFIQGFGAASLGALNATMISDLFDESQRPTAMGYNSAVLSMGATVAPAIGGALTLLGWYYPFLLALFGLPVGLMVLFGLKNPSVRNRQSLLDYVKTVWKGVQQPHVYILYICSVVTFILLYGPLLSYFPFFMEESFGSSSLVIGIVLATLALANGVSSLSLGYLSHRFGARRVLRVSYLFYATALLITPVISVEWLLVVPTLLFGLAQGMNIPNVYSILSSLAPPENRAAFLSLNAMLLRVGQTIGPLIMGLMYVTFSFPGVFLSSAGLALALFALLGLQLAAPAPHRQHH